MAIHVPEHFKLIESICPLCGCGCKLKFIIDEYGNISRSLPAVVDPSMGTECCFKGLISWKGIYRNRILYPYERRENGELRRISWDRALELLLDIFKSYREDRIAFVASGEVTNENNYVIQKFARVVSFTNNIDTCARLCHASTLKALMQTLGIPVMPDYMNDVLNADCILIFGSNPYTNYPTLGIKLLIAKKKGARIVSVQSTVNETSEKLADVIATLEPGSELLFINTLCVELIRRGYINYDVASRIEGWDEFRKAVSTYYPFMVARFCHLDLDVFERIVEEIGKSRRLVIMHGMGVTQTGIGTDIVIGLVDLALIKNAKIISMRGKANIQGAGDMGCSPYEYPTGPISEENRREYENIINASVPEEIGMTLIDFIIRRPVDVLYICGMNPAVSMPYLNRVHKTLSNAITIYHHPFWTKTAEFADIILPLPSLLEMEGTVTNAEGCVRKVNRVVNIVPEAREPIYVFKKVANKLDYGRYFNYSSPRQVFKEICKVQPRYRKINCSKVWQGIDDYADKKPRYKRLIAPSLRPILPRRSIRYPFLLLTARSPYHFCTGDITRNVDELVKIEPKPVLYMNPKDMIALGVKDGDIVKVSSKVGSIKIQVKSNKNIPPGIVMTRYHFESVLVNVLTPPEFDEKSLTPNYKAIPVTITK